MAEEALTWLALREDGVYVDCTVGGAGHASLIAKALRGGRLIGLDRDADAVARARQRLAPFSGVTIVHENYGHLADVLSELHIEQVDGILLDAGFSSMQLDAPRRGLSFQTEGPLDMRLDTSQELTAETYLATVSEPELARVLKANGDVGPARRIAAAIIRRRRAGRLHTTRDLADAVGEALDFVSGMPAETRTVFQAVRIAVNDEYRWLENGLRQAVDVLAPGGRVVAIAFHSGEDRIVKNVFREAARRRRELWPDGRVRRTFPPRVKVLTPSPVRPTEAEIARNARAASAKLRVAERVPAQEDAS